MVTPVRLLGPSSLISSTSADAAERGGGERTAEADGPPLSLSEGERPRAREGGQVVLEHLGGCGRGVDRGLPRFVHGATAPHRGPQRCAPPRSILFYRGRPWLGGGGGRSVEIGPCMGENWLHFRWSLGSTTRGMYLLNGYPSRVPSRVSRVEGAFQQGLQPPLRPELGWGWGGGEGGRPASPPLFLPSGGFTPAAAGGQRHGQDGARPRRRW